MDDGAIVADGMGVDDGAVVAVVEGMTDATVTCVCAEADVLYAPADWNAIKPLSPPNPSTLVIVAPFLSQVRRRCASALDD